MAQQYKWSLVLPSVVRQTYQKNTLVLTDVVGSPSRI